MWRCRTRRDAAAAGREDERAGAIHQLADARLDDQPVPLRVGNKHSYSVRRGGGRLRMDHRQLPSRLFRRLICLSHLA